MSVATAYKDTVEPVVIDGLMVPPIDTIHNLILDMQEQTLVNLKVGIRCYAEIMTIFIAQITVKEALKVINATHTHFPWIEDPVSNLWGDGKIQLIA